MNELAAARVIADALDRLGHAHIYAAAYAANRSTHSLAAEAVEQFKRRV